MGLDFDKEMLLYLGIIVVGIFIIPIESETPFYFIAGIVLILLGIGLVVIKIKR